MHVGPSNPDGPFSVTYDGNPAFSSPGVFLDPQATGDAVWQINGMLGPGTAAQLWMSNFLNWTFKIKYDNAGHLHFIDRSGNDVFGQRDGKTPYIAGAGGTTLLPSYASDGAAASAGVNVGEMYWSSSANAITQRRV